MPLATIEKSDVVAYLEKKFQGVSKDQGGIERRYNDHVECNFARYLLSYIQPYIKEDDELLDIGSGFGSFVYVLKKNGYNAIGIDIADFLVDFARQRIAKEKHETVGESKEIYLKESALNIPFSETQFDLVTMWNVLEHIEDYKKALKEAVRVLKPGGKLFIINVNYAACFIEPHYRVPWLPFLSKKIAIPYLKMLKRDPDYITNGIFYMSSWGVLSALKRYGMRIENPKIAKMSMSNPVITSRRKRILWRAIKLFRIQFLVRYILKTLIFNPFGSSINIVATKK